MESIIDKLKSLGVQKGVDNLEVSNQKKFPVEGVINGEWISTNVGEVFTVTKVYPKDLRLISSWTTQNLEFKNLLSKIQINGDSLNLNDLIFFDTETTGLSGGTGTMIFLIGIGHFIDDGFQIIQFFLNSPENELALLNQLSNFIGPYQMLISYNGSSFDLPLLRTRYRLNGIESPISKKQHLDLLHLSRKIWRLRLQSCKLRDIEVELLSFKRDEEEVPGWMVPQIYFDYLFTGDARPLKGVFYHNSMDVLSLGSLLLLITNVLNKPENQSNIDALDLLSIANFFENIGLIDESINLYKVCMDNRLPIQIKTKFIHKYGLLCKKMGQIDNALELWMLSGSIPSLIEIEKHLEHSKKDYQEALKWTERGIDLINHSESSNPHLIFWETDLNIRRNRLQNKIRKSFKKDICIDE